MANLWSGVEWSSLRGCGGVDYYYIKLGSDAKTRRKLASNSLNLIHCNFLQRLLNSAFLSTYFSLFSHYRNRRAFTPCSYFVISARRHHLQQPRDPTCPRRIRALVRKLGLFPSWIDPFCREENE
jgi:hypothetical protein